MLDEEQEAVLAKLLLEAGIVPARARIRPLPEGMEPVLSAVQEQLWFLERLAPGNSFYNLGPSFRLRGEFDSELFARAVAEVERRHDVLRSNYPMYGGKPVVRVRPVGPAYVRVMDVSAERDPESAASLAARVAMNSGFDLGHDRLMRVEVIKVDRDDHIVVMCFHHIIADSRSVDLVLAEVDSAYRVLRDGGSFVPERARLSYADYAAWQREWLRSPERARQSAYWQSRLAGAPGTLDLPLDFHRPAIQSFRGAGYRYVLSGDLVGEIERVCHRLGVTVFAAVLGAVQVVLRAFSDQDDVVIGTPTGGRNRPEMEDIVGCFFNVAALRGSVSGERTLDELVAQAHEITLEALSHQDLPFDQVVEASGLPRDLSRNPLTQVLLAVPWRTGDRNMSFAGIPITPYVVDVEATVSDLMLYVSATDDLVAIDISYATDLFSEGFVERVARLVGVVLGAFVADGSARVSELELLSSSEWSTVVGEWNAGAGRVVPGTLHGLFERQARLSPEAVAVACGGTEVSFAELDRRARAVAGALRARGAGPEGLVGVCLPRSADLVAVLLGVLMAGAAYVPLDPSYPAERLAFMLADSGVRLVVGDRGSWPEGMGRGTEVLWAGEALAGSPVACGTSVDPECLAYVIYTSGSTGRPKGVAIRHSGITANVSDLNVRFGVGADDGIAALSALGFDMSVYEMIGVLGAGARIVLPEPGREADPSEWLDMISSGGATIWHSVPSRTSMLLDACEQVRCGALSGMRLLLSGGDRLPSALAERAWRTVGDDLVIVNLGGATEASIHSTCAELGRSDLERPALPYGRPMSGEALYILDRWGRPVPVGAAGELYLGGCGLARGYVGRAELTAERFVPDPFGGNGGRLYRTGDVARFRADGCVELIGRADQQVKIRGFRVEIGEVEGALRGAPGVVDAAVGVVAAEGGECLAAYVVTDGTGTELIRHHVRRYLPEYMVPVRWAVLERLPLTPNGKIDRRALLALVAEGVQGLGYVAPQTPAEEVIAAVWSDVLGQSRVSVRDDFFDVGGHSLLATRVTARLRDVFGVSVSVRAIFEHRTIAALAEHLTTDPEYAQVTAGPVPVDSDRPVPASYGQSRLAARVLRPDPALPAATREELSVHAMRYTIPLILRMRGSLHIDHLRDALAWVIDRHSALRTNLAVGRDWLFQVVEPSGEQLKLTVEKVLPEMLEEIFRDEAERKFQLIGGALSRFRMLRVGEDEHVLLATFHHAIADGWSVSLFVRDLRTAYSAIYAGKPLVRSQSLQFRDFTEWQRERYDSGFLARDIAYWRSALRDAPADLALPTRVQYDPLRTRAGRRYIRPLDARLMSALVDRAKSEGMTLYMILLAGYVATLSDAANSDDIIVGTPFSGRDAAGTDEIFGFMVNILPLRVSISGSPDDREIFRRVREVVLDAHAHQGIPAEMLAAEIPEARLAARHAYFSFTRMTEATENWPRVAVEAGHGKRGEPEAGVTLELEIMERPEGAEAVLLVPADAFDDTVLEAFAAELLSRYASYAEGEAT
jgi:amino acid adenylation domain-containing protein